MSGCCENHPKEVGTYEFDVRALDCRVRHGAIFGALESLGDGDTLRFIGDHEPLPLLEQIDRRYGGQVKVFPVSSDEGHVVLDLTIALAPREGGCGCGGEGACGGHGEGGCSHSDED